MRKGDAIAMPTILALALIVVVVLVSFGALNVANGLMDYVDSILRGSKSNIVVENYLNSIECSYRRCKDGCSPALDNLAITVGSEEKRCNTDYCVPFADSDNKVCGALSKDHPIPATLGSSATVSVQELAGRIGVCPNDAGGCAFAAFDDKASKYVNMLFEYYSYVWFEKEKVDAVVEASKKCGVFDHTIPCKAGSAPETGMPYQSCCADSFKLDRGDYYFWSEQVPSGGYLPSTASVIGFSTTDSMSCDKLSEPCMRMRPTNATITDLGTSYSVSFYIQGETNVKAGSSDDGTIEFFSVLGSQWDDMSKVGFKKKDFKSAELQVVDHGCDSFEKPCNSQIASGATGPSAGGPSADALVYNKAQSRLDMAGGADGSTDAWGVAMFYCNGADVDLKVSDLASKDLRVVYTFYKSESSSPNYWYDLNSEKQIAFYIGGMPFKVGIVTPGNPPSNANLYWSPPLPGVPNLYTTFTEKVQSLGNDGKSSKGDYCTAGKNEIGTADALASIADGTDNGFPNNPVMPNWNIRCSVFGTDYNFPWANCRKCGKGCPSGICDDVSGSCSIAWSGAVSIKFPPKKFVCCGTPDSATWQEGIICAVGTNQGESCTNAGITTTCAQKCTDAGYGSPVFNGCRPSEGHTTDCDYCECLSPGSPTVTPTTSTTTTTTSTTTTTTRPLD